tara:strand:+ start:1801 stop:2991 length:1191 start_codon:yes stop_codon:yes gene_type:complete
MSLQNNYQIHSVEASNVRDSYVEFDTVDFDLDFEGRAMVCGSVRLNFEYRILNGTTELGGNENIYFDGKIGGNAFFSSYNTSFQNVGLVENLVEAPRYHAMVANGSLAQDDLLSAQYVCEARSPDKQIQRQNSQMRLPADVGGGAAGTNINQHNGSGAVALGALRLGDLVKPDCSIKPLIAVNNIVGANKLMNYSTSGQVRLTVNLERNNVALYGEAVAAGTNFELTNMRVSFASVPEPSVQLPLQMKAHLCLKSTINSSLANVSSKVPAIADGVSISFLTQTREVSGTFKNTELEKLPSVSKIRYMFNDSTSKYISYELKRIPDMIHEGIKQMNKGNGKNMCRADLLNANKSFLLGLDFGENIDLSKSKFNVSIENDQPISPILMYAYYSSLISL